MTWTPAAPPSAAWDVGSITSIRRITQDGRLRVTEQSVIRIIERFGSTWSFDPPPHGTWTNEA
jgi:hypothetical protein